MDFLKAEIAKRKADDAPVASTSKGAGAAMAPEGPPAAKKYLRKGDLERMKREEEERAAAERRRKADEERQKKLFEGAKKVAAAEDAASKSLKTHKEGPEDPENGLDASHEDSEHHKRSKLESSKPEAFNISNAEAIRRLRNKNQPIRLFGESDKERRLRLRALELIEERTEGQRNDFMRALEGMDKGLDLEELQKRTTSTNPVIEQLKAREGSSTPAPDTDGEGSASEAQQVPKEEQQVDLSLIKTNPNKLYPQIYYGIKRVLKEWEEALAERPESVKRSTQGKLAAATQKQSAEYLKPLFKQLRKRDLAPDVLLAVAEIVHFMQKREYLRANDSYLRLSIGNAPWPIGVTMVGIHERSGREKIFSNNVAHVLNDEVSRKYIQSLKRVLTFAQSKRPPDDLSQRMG